MLFISLVFSSVKGLTAVYREGVLLPWNDGCIQGIKVPGTFLKPYIGTKVKLPLK